MVNIIAALISAARHDKHNEKEGNRGLVLEAIQEVTQATKLLTKPVNISEDC